LPKNGGIVREGIWKIHRAVGQGTVVHMNKLKILPTFASPFTIIANITTSPTNHITPTKARMAKNRVPLKDLVASLERWYAGSDNIATDDLSTMLNERLPLSDIVPNEEEARERYKIASDFVTFVRQEAMPNFELTGVMMAVFWVLPLPKLRSKIADADEIDISLLAGDMGTIIEAAWRCNFPAVAYFSSRDCFRRVVYKSQDTSTDADLT
jgi:hypothetical protein